MISHKKLLFMACLVAILGTTAIITLCDTEDSDADFDGTAVRRVAVTQEGVAQAKMLIRDYGFEYQTTSTSWQGTTFSETSPYRYKDVIYRVGAVSTGYEFVGWLNDDGIIESTSSDYVVSGADYQLISLRLQVREVTKNTFTLYFDSGGGTGGPSTMTYTGTLDAHRFTIPSNVPTKSGYTFAGWSTSSTATTANYQPGGTISVAANSSKTLYAVWKLPTYTYTLYFDNDGGTGGPSTMTYTGTSSGSHTFTIPSKVPTKSGNTFSKWAYIPSIWDVAFYDPGDTITVDANSSKTLRATWKTLYDYKLYYDANGGTGGPSTQFSSGTADSYTFTISSEEPTRSGYAFTGWSTSSTATTANYQPGGSITVPGDSSKTLYAVWKVAYTHTLVFDANGGSEAPSTMTYTGTSSGAHTFTIPDTKPKWTDHIFIGWGLSSTSTTASYQPGDTISIAANSSKTLYAIWKVTLFDAKDLWNGPSLYEYPSGTKIDVEWHTDEDGTEYYPAELWFNAPCMVILNRVTNTDPREYEAKAITFDSSDATTYTVTFNTNDPEYGSVQIMYEDATPLNMDYIAAVVPGTAIKVTDNKIWIGKYAIYGVPKTDTPQYDHQFTSWSGIPSSNQVNSNMTITANFSSTRLYSHILMYDANGGKGAPPMQTADTTSSVSYTFTISVDRPAWKDHTFIGWSTSSTATTASYQPGDTISVSANSTKTLYAVWVDNVFWHVQTHDYPSGNTTYTINLTGFGIRKDRTTYYDVYDTGARTTGLSASVTMEYGYSFTEWKIGIYDTNNTFLQTVSGGTNPSAISWSKMPTLVKDYIYNIYVEYVEYYDLIVDITAVDGHATVSYNGTPLTTSQTYYLDYNTAYELSISNIEPGYYFDQWYIEYPDRTDWESSKAETFRSNLLENTVIQAQLTQVPTPTHYDIYINVNNSDYGHVGRARVSDVEENSTISVDGNKLLVNGTNVSMAYPRGETQQYTYAFVGWTGIPSDGKVTSNLTITAQFSATVKKYNLELDLTAVNGHATVKYNGTTVQTSTVYSLGYGTQYTLSITDIDQEYLFKQWYIEYPPRTDTDSSDSPTYTASLTEDAVIQPQLTGTYTVSFETEPSGYGTVSQSSIQYVPPNSQITIDGSVVTINGTSVTARVAPTTSTNKYFFEGWSGVPESGTVDQDITLTAKFHKIDRGTITVAQGGSFKANTGATAAWYLSTWYEGSLSRHIASSDKYTQDGKIWYNMTIGENTPLGEYTIQFMGVGTHINLNEYTVTVTEKLPDDVWWDNGYINGSVEVAFDFVGLNDSPTHRMTIPLWEYVGGPSSLADDPHGLKQFRMTTYTLEITNGYNQSITLQIKNNGVQVGQTYIYKTGYWEQYSLIIDAQTGSLTFKGIHNIMDSSIGQFSFVNYKPVMQVKIFDFSDIISKLAIGKIYHADSGGDVAPRFQVSATTTYLNTFGFVMVDPVMNIYEKFPNYDNLRLNFYSFAYYGDSVTINGHEMEMSDFSTINVYYIPKGTAIGDGPTKTYTSENIITDADDPLATHGKFDLQNIYVTWTNLKSETDSDRVCYLTFVDGNVSINMGTYYTGDLTVSFDGVWFFTTTLYEPYIGYEKTYEMDWDSWFNLDANAFIILFIIIAGGIFVLMNRIYKPGFLDYAVVIGAGVIAYIMLGGGY